MTNIEHKRNREKKEPLSQIRFVYFDIGGVLYQFRSGLRGIADVLQIPFEECEVIWQQFDNEVCRGTMSPQELWGEMKKATNYKGEDIDFLEFWVNHFSPIPESHKLVHKLAKNYAVGLLTNIYPGVLELALERGRIPDVVYTSIVQSCEVGFVKPQPEIYEIAQRKAGVAPHEILFLDDSLVNINAARERQWKTLLFNRLIPPRSVDQVSRMLKAK